MKSAFNILLILLLSATALQAQDKNVTALIESKNYVFIAESAHPLSGGFRQLTTEYDLRVLGDSIVAYLPYFGRAYAAPIDPTKGGIQFTSTDFEYSQQVRKKGGWNISIKPKDAQDVRQMTLFIRENGNASLQVTSNNRQAISFNGRIEATHPRR
jgi:hypothetical protein